MTKRPLVLLFDIDGTLITSGGVGRRSLENAFAELYGRPDAITKIRLDGMTDGVIVQQALETVGVPASKTEIDRVLNLYLGFLADACQKAPDSTYRLHEGMLSALDAARMHERIAVGLGTGNIQEGARIKLERVRVYDRFAFGGFGSDHDNRIELVRVGAQRGAERLNTPVGECRVVVIGDTPKDVAAAKAVGAECIGVGTGSFSPEALLESGADFAFQSLASPGALEALLGPV